MKKPQVDDQLSRPPLARMLRIHERLKGDRFPNCSQLALDLDVATKTVQRDIDFMRDRMDLPIEFDFRRNGFHYTSPVENFPTVQVTEQELIALFVAEKALAQYKGTPFEKPLHAAFQKLTGSLPEPLTNPLFSIRQGWIIGIALWAVAVECLLVRRVQRRVVGESFWEIGIGDEEFSEGDGIRITGL